MTANEKNILRELAKKYRAIAELPANEERRSRITKTNDLTAGLRPAVWLDEIPWHELNTDDELTLVCEDAFARNMEWYFKTNLYRFNHFQSDTVFPLYYPISKAYTSSGNGMTAEEDIVKVDDKNSIVSHSYHDKLENDEQLAQLHPQILTAYPETDKANVETAVDVLGDILPVKLKGNQIYYAPWDQIPRLRGVEPILLDMFDRPEFIHKIIQKYTADQEGILTQMEDLNLLEDELITLHCTPPYTNDLPKSQNGKVRLKNVWFRAMAQMFNVVSPEMHEEFEMQYMRPLMARCGLVYYGCCEPLDNKLDLLTAIPNMRKIGASPWAKLEVMTERLGNKYVIARKPNPAFVATSFDREAVRNETRNTVELCLKYNCPYEFVLKDISTVGYQPQRLTDWADTVHEVLDEYYK